MNELLLKTWSAPVTLADVGIFKFPSRRSPVTDIVVWTECFALDGFSVSEKVSK